MIRFAICDNNPIQIKLINQLIIDYCINHSVEHEIFEYNCEQNLTENIEYKFDIIFMDILSKQNKNGIKFIQIIKGNNKNCIIIFITGRTDYELEAHKIQAFQYIVKPIDTINFNDILEKGLFAILSG